ncbi:DNA-binding protein [Streptomyces sp. DT20]|uniref:DNA-binding protein n=1 Tax=Streptomyces sp. DT20 TaxID=3416519 RepID=UPI003CEC6AEF
MTEEDVAAASGLPLHTWRRRHGTDFRARVPVVNPGARLRLYDADQATAYVEGHPIPAPHAAGHHPDDLLSDQEVAVLLGIEASTVRAYTSTGYLPLGTERHGRTWLPRHLAEARREAEDQRHNNPGRPTGSSGTQPPRLDPRIAEVAELINQSSVTTATIAQRFGTGERTAQRLLAAARQHAENQVH